MKMNKHAYGEDCLRSWTRLLCFSFLLVLTQNALADKGEPLRIVLTNDDGYREVGIRKMKQALEHAGHLVTVVAPMSERSGSGAALNLTAIRFKQIDPSEWAIDATPATCVYIALSTIVAEAPDLVVSGINNGNNTGAVTPFSGTVGATIAAIYSDLSGGPRSIPAIAFSTDAPVDSEIDPAGFESHFEDVAIFAVNLIENLQLHGEPLLPERVALNVNYPPLAREEIKGVKINTQGNGFDIKLNFIEQNVDGKQVFVPTLVEQARHTPELQLSDVSAFNNGFITIVPIDGNYSASAQIQRQLELSVASLLSSSLEVNRKK